MENNEFHEANWKQFLSRHNTENKSSDRYNERLGISKEEVINSLKNTVTVTDDFIKYDSDKLRYDLIPPEVMKAMANVLTYGAQKYSDDNWKKCNDDSRYIGALYRHLEEWRLGNEIDDESGLPHLHHALTNLAFLVYFND